MKKYDIIISDLEKTRGAEKYGVRPCVVLQNNLTNASKIQTVTVAPLTTTPRAVLSAIWVIASKENGLKSDSRIEISQIRTIDRTRIISTIGHLEAKYYDEVREKIINFLDLFDEYSSI